MPSDENRPPANIRSFDRRHATVALLLVGLLIGLPLADFGPLPLRELAGDLTGVRPPPHPVEGAAAPVPQGAPVVPSSSPTEAGAPENGADPAERKADAEKAVADEPAPASDAKALAATTPAPVAQPVPIPPVAKIYFDMRQEELSPEARDVLAPFVAYLNENADAAVRIFGYYPRGDSASGPNAALMWRRTLAVREAFERAGIAANRVMTLRPIDAKNGTGPTARRIDVAIAPSSASPSKSRRTKSKTRWRPNRDEIPRAETQREEIRLGEVHRGEIF